MTQKRNNWQDFERLLQQHGITKLYHFTDRDNLASIIRNGGLYSWADCEQKGIVIPKAGSNLLSRQLDAHYNLQNYVCTSFCRNHPMKHIAMQEGRISNPVLLEISPEVIYWQQSLFADRNAVKNGAQRGDDLAAFSKIRFDVTQRDYRTLTDDEKEYYQAEVLVRECIPLKYILNINSLGIHLPNCNQLQVREPYTAQVTRETPTAFIFLVDQSASMDRTTLFGGRQMPLSEAVTDIVNRSLHELVLRCVKGNEVRHYYDIAVLGYHTEVRSAWEGALADKAFVSPEDLRANPYKIVTKREEKRTRRGVEEKEVERIYWIEKYDKGTATHLHTAMQRAKNLLQEWITRHEGKMCYPPTIINITDGEYNGCSDDDIQQLANEIKSLDTIDGNVLFFNVHISPTTDEHRLLFPVNKSEVEGNSCAEKLYEISSLLPQRYSHPIENIMQLSSSQHRRRGLVMNADMNVLIKVLEIGTPTNITTQSNL